MGSAENRDRFGSLERYLGMESVRHSVGQPSTAENGPKELWNCRE